jgi:hypothetical protein
MIGERLVMREVLFCGFSQERRVPIHRSARPRHRFG